MEYTATHSYSPSNISRWLSTDCCTADPVTLECTASHSCTALQTYLGEWEQIPIQMFVYISIYLYLHIYLSIYSYLSIYLVVCFTCEGQNTDSWPEKHSKKYREYESRWSGDAAHGAGVIGYGLQFFDLKGVWKLFPASKVKKIFWNLNVTIRATCKPPLLAWR